MTLLLQVPTIQVIKHVYLPYRRLYLLRPALTCTRSASSITRASVLHSTLKLAFTAIRQCYSDEAAFPSYQIALQPCRTSEAFLPGQKFRSAITAETTHTSPFDLPIALRIAARAFNAYELSHARTRTDLGNQVKSPKNSSNQQDLLTGNIVDNLKQTRKRREKRFCKLIGVALLTSLGLMCNNVVAQDLLKNGPSVFNYNYADAVYIDDDGADGLGLRFSADIRNNYALQVGYSRLGAGSFDFDSVSGGVAYHIEAARFPGKADWVFDVSFQTVDAAGIDETGLNASAGLRYAVNDALEVNGAVVLNTLFDTDISLTVRALYEVATGFSALLETDIGDGSAIGLGLRFYWR